MAGLQDTRELIINTPYGEPSSPIVVGLLEGQPVAFLSRHGAGHHLSPSMVPYRANIYALKSLGVQRIVSISACGSLREDFVPGDIVIPDQIMDFTRDRKRTFFEDGVVAHVSVAEPFCTELSDLVYQSVKAADSNVHFGGALITIEGPRFSTRAEFKHLPLLGDVRDQHELCSGSLPGQGGRDVLLCHEPCHGL